MKFCRFLFSFLACSITALYGWSWSEKYNINQGGLKYVYEKVHGSNGYVESTILHCAGPTNKSNYKADNLVIPEKLTFTYYDNSSYNNETVTINVTSLYAEAFKDCTGLTGKVTLPSSLTQISESAFSGCTGITEVAFPSKLSTIDASSFKGCTGLTHLDFPASLRTIGSSAFSNCTGLTGTLTPPDNLKTLGDHAFSGCTELTSVNFPPNMPVLGEYAFSGCTGLTGTLTLTNSVDGWAFSGCTGITDIVFPTSTHSIGEYAFLNCTGLTGELYLTASTVGTGSFMNCKGLTSLVLAKTVSKIGYCNHSEWNVSLQTNASKHGYRDTFVGCTSLESITVYGAPPSFSKANYHLNGNCFEDYTVPLYVESEFYSQFASEWQWVNFNNVYKLAKGISLSASSITVKVGEKGIINYSLQPVDAATANLKWTPEDPAIATVSDGIVTGHSVGQTFVTVSCGTVSAKCLVNVVAETQGGGGTVEPSDDACEWHQDGDENATLYKRIYMIPDDEDNFALLLDGLTAASWTSGNDDIVEVTKRGLAYAYDFGETVVRAKDADGKTIAIFEVFVCPTVTVEHGDGVLYSHHVLYNSCPTLTLRPGEGNELAGVTHDGKPIDETLVSNEGKYIPTEPITQNSVINMALKVSPNGGPTTGASSVWSDSSIRIYVEGHNVRIVGASPGATVEMTNQLGMSLYKGKMHEINVYDAGVYLVIVDGETFKILVK